MQLRVGVRRIANVVLYMGPLLAGLAGYGWGLLPPFVSMFLCWLILQRPHHWPQSGQDWRSAPALLVVLTQVLSQILLVAMLFGLGRGLGGVAGHLPLLDPLLPLSISFLALPMLRLVNTADRARAQGRALDDLILAATPRQNPRRAPQGAAVDDLSRLLALPDAADPAEVTALLEGLADSADPWPRLAALAEYLAGCPAEAHLALRRVLIAWAADKDRFAAGDTPGALRLAFAAAGQEVTLLRLLLPPALHLAREHPGRQDRFPPVAVLEDIARRSPKPAVRRALNRLAEELRGSPVALPA